VLIWLTPASDCVLVPRPQMIRDSGVGEIRLALDQGLSTEAKSRLTSFISTSNHPNILALARCALPQLHSRCQGHYRESLGVAMYESGITREIHEQNHQSSPSPTGLAYNYNGDHPKADCRCSSRARVTGKRATMRDSDAPIQPSFDGSIAASVSFRLRVICPTEPL